MHFNDPDIDARDFLYCVMHDSSFPLLTACMRLMHSLVLSRLHVCHRPRCCTRSLIYLPRKSSWQCGSGWHSKLSKWRTSNHCPRQSKPSTTNTIKAAGHRQRNLRQAHAGPPPPST